MKTVKTTAFLQIEPEWSRWNVDHDDPGAVQGAKAVRLTQNRSRRPQPGVVEIAVTIEIPTAAFIPLRPEATIVIPEGMTIPHPVVIEATNPNEE